jgi:hypothetical protein
MKLDTKDTSSKTWTFNKHELIDILVEAYQKASGKIIADIDKKKCRLYANAKETQNVELVFSDEIIEGKDFNGS